MRFGFYEKHSEGERIIPPPPKIGIRAQKIHRWVTLNYKFSWSQGYFPLKINAMTAHHCLYNLVLCKILWLTPLWVCHIVFAYFNSTILIRNLHNMLPLIPERWLLKLFLVYLLAVFILMVAAFLDDQLRRISQKRCIFQQGYRLWSQKLVQWCKNLF